MRPLEGVFVLDFSTLLPGPMATLLLAEAGAEVVKVEPLGAGENMRSYHPQWGPFSVNFALLNRGKKGIALDLKDKAAREKFQPLVDKADVIVEQFRPGVMARLGLDYETVSKKNPKVVYASITGYGQDGPKRDVAGHDLNYIADAGLLALSMGTKENPSLPPALIADIAGGAYPTVFNILLALREREKTGQGRYIDIAMAESIFPFMYWSMGNGLAAGEWPVNAGERVTGGTARFFLYSTKDGKAVAAAPLEQKFWETFCDVIHLEPQFRDDDKNPEATKKRVAEIIASENSDVWVKRFAGKDCCCSIVATIQEALNDPHFKARGLFRHKIPGPDGRTMPALPVPIAPAFRASPDDIIGAPTLGQHNKEYLR